jgi:hypothetical protein
MRAPSALRSVDILCFSVLLASSADLHVVEFAFKRGFDSFRARPLNVVSVTVLVGRVDRDLREVIGQLRRNLSS